MSEKCVNTIIRYDGFHEIYIRAITFFHILVQVSLAVVSHSFVLCFSGIPGNYGGDVSGPSLMERSDGRRA